MATDSLPERAEPSQPSDAIRAALERRISRRSALAAVRPLGERGVHRGVRRRCRVARGLDRRECRSERAASAGASAAPSAAPSAAGGAKAGRRGQVLLQLRARLARHGARDGLLELPRADERPGHARPAQPRRQDLPPVPRDRVDARGRRPVHDLQAARGRHVPRRDCVRRERREGDDRPDLRPRHEVVVLARGCSGPTSTRSSSTIRRRSPSNTRSPTRRCSTRSARRASRSSRRPSSPATRRASRRTRSARAS